MPTIGPRFAVISDIHSNLEALTAVLEDIRNRGIDDIICLGDVLGYGPSPNEVLDLVMDTVQICLTGNHDEAILRGPINFSPWSRDAILWSQESLREGPPELVKRRFAYLSSMALTHKAYGFDFVHGSPRHPTLEYIQREDIDRGDFDKFDEIFNSFEKCLFVGHTHTPCVISQGLRCYRLEPIAYHHNLEGDPQKFIINVGSVGQSRDGDTRACYVEVEDQTVFFHRVSYDIETTIARIDANDRLNNRLGERLARGV